MNTPICDYVNQYAAAAPLRLHMPGHKGQGPLGVEGLDITEISGADSLYEASGIIRESERNASALYGCPTFYSTEGSSQCIRAMVRLAMLHAKGQGRALRIAAGRNAHKAFLSAAALLDGEVVWLYGKSRDSYLSCGLTAQELERAFAEEPLTAVYITSPDYLGNMADIQTLAAVCHRHGALLLVDNAHGAYLRFLPGSLHPMDLGADLCCDSAHKTLPVLTGGAYLHVGCTAPKAFAERAKAALALFGSTSPSYLTMASLDLCNRYLADGYSARLARCVEVLGQVRAALQENGWQVEESDPLRLTLRAPQGMTGIGLADCLREKRVECEYADDACVVLMVTPENPEEDLLRLVDALGSNDRPYAPAVPLVLAKPEQVVSIRQALFAPCETVPAETAVGRICGAPTVSCPPAIPIVVSGERIGGDALALFQRYGVEVVDVVI